MHESHALASAACRRLEHDRVADLIRNFLRFLRRGEAARGSGNEWDGSFFHVLAGACFRAHHFHGLWRRADEFNSGIGACLGKLCIFREEAVAGMDRLSARAPGDIQDFVYPEVRFRRRGGADRISLIGLADVERATIDIGVNGDRGDAHFATCAHDANSDLSAIGNQDLLEHFSSPTSGPTPILLANRGSLHAANHKRL